MGNTRGRFYRVLKLGNVKLMDTTEPSPCVRFMTPVFGVLLSSLMLSEQSTVSPLNLIAALVLICGGIVILNKSPEQSNYVSFKVKSSYTYRKRK